MPDLIINIKTPAQLDGAEKAHKSLLAAVGVAKEGTPVHAALRAEVEKVSAALKSESAEAVRLATNLQAAMRETKAAGGDVSGLAAQLNLVKQQHGVRLPGVISKAGGVLGEMVNEIPGVGAFGRVLNGSKSAVGLAGIGVSAGIASIREFAQAEVATTKLDAALAQTGHLTESVRRQYQGLAGELQKTTAIADDEWLGVLARLTQFGSTPQSIGMDIEAVKNLAGLLGGDVQQAAQIYSRALQGNFEMLRRYGVQVDESASQTEKLTQLQEQLALRGGGQLEASAKTLNGQWRLMKANIGDMFEGFGKWIARTQVVQTVLYGLGKSAEWVAEKVGGTVPKVDGLKNALVTTKLKSEESQNREGFIQQIGRDADAAQTKLTRLQQQISSLADFERQKARREKALELAGIAPDLPPEEQAKKRAEIELRYLSRTGQIDQGEVEALAKTKEEEAARIKKDIAGKKTDHGYALNRVEIAEGLDRQNRVVQQLEIKRKEEMASLGSPTAKTEKALHNAYMERNRLESDARSSTLAFKEPIGTVEQEKERAKNKKAALDTALDGGNADKAVEQLLYEAGELRKKLKQINTLLEMDKRVIEAEKPKTAPVKGRSDAGIETARRKQFSQSTVEFQGEDAAGRALGSGLDKVVVRFDSLERVITAQFAARDARLSAIESRAANRS